MKLCIGIYTFVDFVLFHFIVCILYIYIYTYIYKYKCNVCLNAIDLISVLPLLPTKTSNVSMSISSK